MQYLNGNNGRRSKKASKTLNTFSNVGVLMRLTWLFMNETTLKRLGRATTELEISFVSRLSATLMLLLNWDMLEKGHYSTNTIDVSSSSFLDLYEFMFLREIKLSLYELPYNFYCLYGTFMIRCVAQTALDCCKNWYWTWRDEYFCNRFS